MNTENIPTIELALALKRAKRDTKLTQVIAYILRQRAYVAATQHEVPLPRQLSTL